jgi:hypothetical protein
MPSEFSTLSRRSVVRAPAALHLQELPTPSGEKASEPQSRCEHSGGEEENPCHCGESNPNHPDLCHTELSGLYLNDGLICTTNKRASCCILVSMYASCFGGHDANFCRTLITLTEAFSLTG